MKISRITGAPIWIALATLTPGLVRADTPVLSQVTGDLEGPCLRLSFLVDIGGPNSRAGMYLGFDPDPSDEMTAERRRAKFAQKSRTTSSCTLAPNRRTYVQPFSTDAQNEDEGRLRCSQPCENCDFGAGPTPLSCDSEGEAPFVELGPSEGIQEPVEPVHSFDPMQVPDIDGETFLVNCVDGVATDLAPKLAKAAAANGDQWHRVEIPSGCTVRQHVRIPARSSNGPGGVLITTAGDPRLFPPPGVRIDPSYTGKLARFEAPSDWSTGGVATSVLTGKVGLQGYRFQNIEIAPPEHENVPVQRLVVADVEVRGRGVSLILAEPPGVLPVHRRVMLDIRGCSGLQGRAVVLRVQGRRVQLGGLFDVTGSCTGGTLTQAVSHKIESCTPGAPVICKTSEPHGLPRLESLGIASIAVSGDGVSVATLAEPMHTLEGNGTPYIEWADIVRVQGSGTDLDGRFSRVLGRSNTTVRLNGSSDCKSSCGSLHEIHPIQIFGTGADGLDGTRHFVPLDDSTIQVFGAELGEAIDGGFLSYDPEVLGSILFRNSSRFVFDRVLLDCGPFPYRMAACLNMNGSDRFGLVNSYIRGRSFWLPMDPITKSPASAWDGRRSFAPQNPTLYVSDTVDVQVLNTTIHGTHGITILSERFNRVSEDHTVRRVTIHKPDRFVAGHPKSDGRYYQDRHCWETKSARRFLLEGLRCSGNWADWTPAGQAILFSPRGPSNNGEPVVTSDIIVRGSVLDRTASGIMLAGDDIGKSVGPIQRALITNNLFQQIDFFEYRSSISGVNGHSPSSNFGGAVLTLANQVSSLQFTKNTIGLQRGKSTALLNVIGRHGSKFRFDDNIVNFSRTGSGVLGIATEATECGRRAGAETFHCLVQRGGERDPDTTFDGNLIYGCSRRGDVVDEAGFEASLDSPETSISAEEAREYFGDIHNRRENEFLDDLGPVSCGDRMDAIFEPGSFQQRPEFSGKGADMDLLATYLGEVGPISVEKSSSSQVVIRYKAPDAEACHIDYSTDGSFSVPELITRVQDGGGDRDRAVTLSGLAPATSYAFRVLCAAQQPRGVFTTSP